MSHKKRVAEETDSYFNVKKSRVIYDFGELSFRRTYRERQNNTSLFNYFAISVNLRRRLETFDIFILYFKNTRNIKIILLVISYSLSTNI